MAVILYKPGNVTKVRGIPCQIQVCNEFSYLHLLDQGWFYTPEECYADEEVENDNEIDEIRAKAKEAGIGHWHTKSMDRLVSEIEELENAERSEN